MNKTIYLQDLHLQTFVDWIQHKIDTPNTFIHNYDMLKPKRSWECHSIHNAFEEYEWKFDSFNPITYAKISGKTFTESSVFLDQLSEGLNESITLKNEELCKTYCFAILKWGGVSNKNKDKIESISLEYGLIEYFSKIKEILNPELYDISKHKRALIDARLEKLYEMNAGFTKIYSLLLNDFIIYDGRVGAALGLFVRLYCEENNLSIIPEHLAFAYGDSRTTKNASGQNRRNPSFGNFRFSKLDNTSEKHTYNNMKANWLLNEIITKTESNFNQLEKKKQLRAFEAALFMIGYDVKSYKNNYYDE